jgi:hypothetical protein
MTYETALGILLDGAGGLIIVLEYLPCVGRLLGVTSPDALGKARLNVLANVAATRAIVQRRCWICMCSTTVFAEEIVQETVSSRTGATHRWRRPCSAVELT